MGRGLGGTLWSSLDHLPRTVTSQLQPQRPEPASHLLHRLLESAIPPSPNTVLRKRVPLTAAHSVLSGRCPGPPRAASLTSAQGVREQARPPTAGSGPGSKLRNAGSQSPRFPDMRGCQEDEGPCPSGGHYGSHMGLGRRPGLLSTGSLEYLGRTLSCSSQPSGESARSVPPFYRRESRVC